MRFLEFLKEKHYYLNRLNISHVSNAIKNGKHTNLMYLKLNMINDRTIMNKKTSKLLDNFINDNKREKFEI